MLSKEELEILKISIDPVSLLLHLGFDVHKETLKELRGPCIIHGGDNKSGFRYNKDTNTWVCFTNKCNEKHGNDAIGLIMAVKHLSFVEAVEYLDQLVGGGKFDYSEVVKYKYKRDKDSFIHNLGIVHKPDIVTEEFLKNSVPFRSSLFTDSGFSKHTLDYFEIAGGYTDKIGHARDIIPIRNDKQELVAFSFRDIEKGCNEDYKYIATDDFCKDRVLYNMCNAKELGKSTPLIVVEGFKSVWRLHEWGFYNTVAIMGSSMTTGQANLLLAYALKGVALMLDNDTAGKNGTKSALKLLKGKLPVTPIYITNVDKDGKGLDPSDLTIEQFLDYMELL